MPVSVTESATRTSPSARVDGPRAHDNLAILGELDGVAEEVEEDLLQARRVPGDQVRQADIKIHDQFQALLQRLEGELPDGLLQAMEEVEGDVFQLELPGLDLGKVEDVIDEREQRVGAREHGLQITLLLGREFRIQAQLAHADDAVDGGADFMRDVGEEVALGLAGEVGLADGGAQLLLIFALRA